MDTRNHVLPGKISNRSGDAQNAGIAPRSEPHYLRSLREQFASGFVGRGDPFEQFTVCLSIGTRAVLFIARGLDGARCGNPCGNGG